MSADRQSVTLTFSTQWDKTADVSAEPAAVAAVLVCPLCRAKVAQMHFCDGCYARCCAECAVKMDPKCEHPTDVWQVPVKLTKTPDGKPLRFARWVLQETHVAPYGHLWRVESAAV